MKKTYLFIDGTNLYAGQYELFGPKTYLNFIKLIKTIEKNFDICFTKIFLYESLTNKDIDVYLFSGDADFLQALIKVKSVNKNPIVISLQNRIMYKAVYFFKLIIISFDSLWKV